MAEMSRCQLCGDVCLTMINFIMKWLRADILDELSFYCKPQVRALLGGGEVRQRVCIALLPQLSSL